MKPVVERRVAKVGFERIGKLNLTKTKDILLNTIIEQPRICSVVFRTNSGRLAKVWGRVGVTKYLKGIGKRSIETNSKYILFYDFNKGYRNINRDNIVAVNGLNLKIEG
jgi:hypothetical protein